jgi:glycosyltransferase involved in cell wall biosynthesis
MAYFFDATVSLSSPLNTGIQRVVRAIAQETGDGELSVVVAQGAHEPLTYLRIDPASLVRFLDFESQKITKLNSCIIRLAISLRPILVQFYRIGFFRKLKDRMRSRIVNLQSLNIIDLNQETLRITSNDTYITFDAFWNSTSDYKRLVQASEVGSKVVILVHDIFPLTHPEWFEKTNIINFHKYFISGVEKATNLLFSSKASLHAFEIMFPDNNAKKDLIPFGSDKLLGRVEDAGSESGYEQERNQILMIGTIEPRKNYLEVLKWFEATRLDATLVIIGRNGWKSGKVTRKIRSLRRKGYKVEWQSSVPDKQLMKLLTTASIGLCASLDEGFGLPLREFTACGLPIAASDIEVFREIENPNIIYFKLGDMDSLERAVKKCLNMNRYQGECITPTWLDSYRVLLGILNDTQT